MRATALMKGVWMANGFSVEVERVEDNVHAVSVQGELDQATADQLRQPLGAAIDAGARAVMIDLSDCDFIDSTGLAILVDARQRLVKAGVNGAFSICCPNSQVRRLLEITAMDEAMGLFDSRDQALAALRP